MEGKDGWLTREGKRFKSSAVLGSHTVATEAGRPSLRPLVNTLIICSSVMDGNTNVVYNTAEQQRVVVQVHKRW